MRSGTVSWHWIALALVLVWPAAPLMAQENADRQQAKASTEVDAEIAALRDEVRALRGDVGRLIELLESRSAATPERQATSPPRDMAATDDDDQQTFTVTYNVADLVTPIRKMVTVTVVGSKVEANPPIVPANPDYELLKAYITSRIRPESWDIIGGPGAIQAYRNNLSLVITHTEEGHREIAELLSALRRVEFRQVALDAVIIAIDERAAESIARRPSEDGQLLTAAQVKTLLDLAQNDRRSSLFQAPRVKLFAEQTANLQIKEPPQIGSLELLIHAALGKELPSVRLRVAVNAKDKSDVLRLGDSLKVPEGQSLLFDLPDETDAAANRDDVMSTILFGNSVPRAAKSPGNKTIRRLLLVTPRIVDNGMEERMGFSEVPARP